MFEEDLGASLREKCPSSELFRPAFSRIWTEPNAGKYGPEYLLIWTHFTQCIVSVSLLNLTGMTQFYVVIPKFIYGKKMYEKEKKTHFFNALCSFDCVLGINCIGGP